MAAGCPGGDQCGKDCGVDLSPLNFTDYGAATVDDGGGYAHADVTPTIEDYVYEYGNESMTVPLEELPVGIIYGMTFLLGITGNTLVIISALRYRRMQNVTNIFLISLASADLLLVALCVPIKVRAWQNYIVNRVHEKNQELIRVRIPEWWWLSVAAAAVAVVVRRCCCGFVVATIVILLIYRTF